MRQCAAEERIKDINTQSLGKKFSDMINEITLITGLKVDEQQAKPFAVLLSKFLLSYYGILSCSEVTLAFRLNAMGDLPGVTGQGKESEKIDFYGGNLTIDHIGGVLHRYMQKRANLADKLIKQRGVSTDDPPLTPEEEEIQDKSFANEYYRKYLNGEFSAVSLEYAYLVYDTLDKRGMINLSNKQKSAYMEEAQSIRDREIAAPAISRPERKAQNKLMEAYLNDMIPREEANLVKCIAKRLALMDIFKTWKASGKTKIFEV